MGISPDIIVLRCDDPITDEAIFRKISNFCSVKPDCVIENVTIPTLYEAPLMLEKNNFSSVVCRELGIDAPQPDLTEWKQLVERIKSCQPGRAHRAGGQIRAAPRRVSLRGGSPASRGLRPGRRDAHRLGGFRNRHPGKRGGSAGATRTAFWCPAASASVASRA